jgi:hypothetical protein
MRLQQDLAFLRAAINIAYKWTCRSFCHLAHNTSHRSTSLLPIVSGRGAMVVSFTTCGNKASSSLLKTNKGRSLTKELESIQVCPVACQLNVKPDLLAVPMLQSPSAIYIRQSALIWLHLQGYREVVRDAEYSSCKRKYCYC